VQELACLREIGALRIEVVPESRNHGFRDLPALPPSARMDLVDQEIDLKCAG
jgi:hypothetical protein